MPYTCLAYDLNRFAKRHGKQVVADLVKESPYIREALNEEHRRNALVAARSAEHVNSGLSWTIEEDERLMRDLARGVCVGDMALALGRSITAVKVRASVLRARERKIKSYD